MKDQVSTVMLARRTEQVQRMSAKRIILPDTYSSEDPTSMSILERFNKVIGSAATHVGDRE